MAVDGFLSGLELDCFEDILQTPVHETLSDVRTIVLTNCFGRGKSIADITIPRLPKGVPTRIALIPDVDVRRLLPTRKRAGRGRARILSHTDDIIQPVKPQTFKAKPFKPVSRNSLFELPIGDFECSVSNDGSTDVDTFELYVSDEEDEGYVPILPSQRGVCSHPFGLPPKAKKLFNVKSAEDFPTLGGKNQDPSIKDSNDSATSARLFPPLPPRLSKKVTNLDIVFKPMKERKKKKRKENLKKSPVGKSDCISEDTDCVSVDGDCSSIQGKDDDQDDFIADGMPSITETELSPSNAGPGLVRSVGEEAWSICGENVIQVDGLPNSEDVAEFESMLSNYGTVLEVENKDMSRGKRSIRVRYSEEDACEFAISCLDDSDCVFPDHRLQCYRLPN